MVGGEERGTGHELESRQALLARAACRLFAVVAIVGGAGCGAGQESCRTVSGDEMLYGETLDAVDSAEEEPALPAASRYPRAFRSDVVLRVRRDSAWLGESLVGIAHDSAGRYVAFVLAPKRAADPAADDGTRERSHPLDAAVARGVVANFDALIRAARSGKAYRGVYDGDQYAFALPTGEGNGRRATTDSPARCTRAAGAVQAAVALAEYAGDPSRREAALAALRGFAREDPSATTPVH